MMKTGIFDWVINRCFGHNCFISCNINCHFICHNKNNCKNHKITLLSNININAKLVNLWNFYFIIMTLLSLSLLFKLLKNFYYCYLNKFQILVIVI